MSKVTKGILTLVSTWAITAVTTTARADSVSVSGARYTVEAECSDGSKDVLVVQWSNRSLAMYIYQNGRLIKSGNATKRIVENSARLKIVGYALGTVASGGANLRIRTRDSEFPRLAGTGHLTMRGSNALVECDSAN